MYSDVIYLFKTKKEKNFNLKIGWVLPTLQLWCIDFD